jgi:NAD(P)H-hydrate epimerase
MATGGSGDVLAGIIAGFIAQGLSPRAATDAGVYLHGLAGDFAALRHTRRPVSALKIIQEIPNTFAWIGVD